MARADEERIDAAAPPPTLAAECESDPRHANAPLEQQVLRLRAELAQHRREDARDRLTSEDEALRSAEEQGALITRIRIAGDRSAMLREAIVAHRRDLTRSGLSEVREALAPRKRAVQPAKRIALSIVASLRSYPDYLAFRQAHPEAFSAATERAISDQALIFGTRTEFLGDVGPDQTSIGEGDLRECLGSGGLNSRMRAICDLLLEELRKAGKSPADATIYAHEAVTYLASLLRARFPRFLGSEYAPSEEAQRRLLPYIHNDVCASRFTDGAFDATMSCDVLEHVQDLDAALREAARTTVQGGVFLATLPFFSEREVGSIFAEIKNDVLVHHLSEPIYHGNPMDESAGALVFAIPGWDLLPRVREAGFGDVEMRFICDAEKGVVASGEGRDDGPRGVFVLVARK